MDLTNLENLITTFSSVEPVTIPMGIETLSYGKKWLNWGDDNLYPNYLSNLINISTLHASIMKQKAMLIGGGGFDKTNMSPSGLYFLKNVYNDDEMDDILSKVAFDLELYGGFALNLIWDKARITISEVNYVDLSMIRIVPGDKCDKYAISNNWSDPYKNQPVVYDAFSLENKQKASQILYVKEHREMNTKYPKPEYKPGIKWFEIDNMISDFHYTGLKKNFFPAIHINFPIGTPSKEEADSVVRRTKKQYEGATGDRTIITFSDSKDDAATFDIIQPNSSDTMFIMLNEMVEKSILKAHRVINPSLFGIETPGSLGSRNEMLESLEIFQTAYVNPKQMILEKVFNRIRKINNIPDQLIIKRYSPQFSKIDTNIGDVLSILTASITPKQKYELLIQNSYTHEAAMNLTGYPDGNNEKSITTNPDININTTNGTK